MNLIKRATAVAAAMILPGVSFAIPLYDTFGPLDEATFGGQGIPNQEVAVSSQFEDGTTLITLGLSATQRYENPALNNDGAGTYFATTGSNFGGGANDNSSTIEGALWNFNFYIDVDSPDSGYTLADYQILMYYDFDPTFDNGPVGLGVINVTNAVLASADPTATRFEGSQNLLFDFLATDAPGFIDAPDYAAFDPNATGEYNFAIQVQRAGWAVEQVRMDVQVVPIPAAAVLFPSALAMLGWVRRRRND